MTALLFAWKDIADPIPEIPVGFLSRVKNVNEKVAYQTSGRITWNIERWELQ